MSSARHEPAEAVPELIDDERTGAQTLRLVPQSLAELAAEWAEQLERRRAAETAAAFWDAAAELQEGA